jgi:protein-tyrosine phosphatase
MLEVRAAARSNSELTRGLDLTDFRKPPQTRFERIANFRDLAGHTTRDGRRLAPGRLLRSGHLGRASQTDVQTLAGLGLRKVYDFRTSSDIELDGTDRLPTGTAAVRLPMPDPAKGQGIRELIEESDPEELEMHFGDGKAAAMMRKHAAGLVRERREPYGVFLRSLATDSGTPALFHCSAGKDRAGWAASVVLMTLGVSKDQVVEQYLLSNRALRQIAGQQKVPGRAAWADLLRPLLEVREEYIESSFTAVEEEWGGFDGYLERGLGISEAERDAIRKNLLE